MNPTLFACGIGLFLGVCHAEGNVGAWSTPYTSSSATNSDLLSIGDKLWSADIQKFRLYRGEIELSVQNKTTPDSTIDHASQRLFQYIESARLSKPSYTLFNNLINNNDNVTSVEDREAFLKHLTTTRVMKLVRQFLATKGVIADDTLSFTSLLNSLWFGEGDSSESLFTTLMTGGLGEGKILNWLKFYNLEKEGTVNYMGYYGLSEPRLIEFQYSKEGSSTPHSTKMFIGTSPEFEMALHTICLVTRPNKRCTTQIRGNRVTVFPAVMDDV